MNSVLKCDKLNLDICWLKDESLEDSANLANPNIIAAEIAEDLQAALAQVETRSLPTLTHCFPRSFTLITRTASCLRQLP